MKRKKIRLLPLDEGIKVQREEDFVENLRLREALKKLPEKYRLPIVLYYMEDYPTKTIAGLLEIPEGRLRERMRTARKLLGSMLKHEADE